MFRGTTPTLTFTIPFGLEEGDVIYITFAQNGETIFEKTNSDIDIAGNVATLLLSQEDTLLLTEGIVEIQIRVRTIDGTALASKIMRTSANAILKDGVI